MKQHFYIKFLLVGFAFVIFGFQKDASNDAIIATWMPGAGTSHVRIFKGANAAYKGKYYGKIVRLKEPNDESGNPKKDANNPVVAKRITPLLDLIILRDFVWDESDNEYNEGSIYDPKNGKTYSCYMKMDGDKLNVRGYIGISLIGRTDVWTKVN